MPTLVDAPDAPDAAEEVPSSASKSKAGKRRTNSPTVPSDAASSSSQAIAAANLAAAVQMAASLQLNGLLSLLTQSSAPGVAASAADPTVLQATALSASLSSSSWQIPTPEQAKQAALKAAQESPPFVHLSKSDSAPQLKIVDQDRLTLKGGMRGYRMSRATHGVSQGCYYFEALVLDPPTIQEIVASLPPNARLGSSLQRQIQQALEYEKQHPAGEGKKRKAEETVPPDSSTKKSKSTIPPKPQVGGHLRIGWSMRTGDLQAPVGYDKWSYGFRNISGSKIHQSRREDNWGGEPWGPGDVVGCAIFLDTTAAAAANPDGSNNNNNNHIRFFKNGEPMGHFFITKGKREGGAAFENIQPGTYYPAVSSYLGGSVQVNFGPHFIHPPRKLPHGMSGKLQPVSSVEVAPLSRDELLARLKKKNIFSKVGKESPDAKVQAFKEAILAESQVLQESYKQHRRKHLEFVMATRQARNLNVSDLQQELDQLDEGEKDETKKNTKEEETAPMELDDKKQEEEKEKAAPVAPADVAKEEAKEEASAPDCSGDQ
ncbi:Set1/Ash2 histone methyltransferase complex subunit ASH2 [Seminavis robusta]|uniref:Set1/Ash2 histone methyltransferase complex subunit ASH2 n=1 Tax=Seminavis robusta TaxID=568900 RepID=A0A9N8DL69_9STRA|nr:Set1/Ash2 histone methyltransferase complex subunit ASH2 [Seminavis robusta]|eukprot:Sro184_g080070.1 Set1/Ash2 histone methyltransferase complex subunit ASH2 (545) ;mRNA; r:78235-79869